MVVGETRECSSAEKADWATRGEVKQTGLTSASCATNMAEDCACRFEVD